MMKTTITWPNDDFVVVYYKDIDEMIKDIRRFEGYNRLEAYEIDAKDMRQGRCR